MKRESIVEWHDGTTNVVSMYDGRLIVVLKLVLRFQLIMNLMRRETSKYINISDNCIPSINKMIFKVIEEFPTRVLT